MRNLHQINKKSQWKYLYKKTLETIFISIIIVFGYAFYKNISDYNLISNFVLGTLIMISVIYFIPLFLLYFNHLKYSKSVILIYDDVEKLFLYKKKKSETTFRVEDIQEVNFYLTPAGYKETFDLSLHRDYRYYEIFLYGEEKIYISCLTCDCMESYIPNSLIKRKKKFLPLIGTGSIW